MDTIPLEMDELFGDNDDDDDIMATRLPDLDLEENLQPMLDSRYDESNEQAEDGEEPLTDNPELLAKLKSLKGASKNVQKRTFIKLDATRLTGERGIPILPQVFKNIKLKGKHHEAEDLKTIMHHLEHWGHRLFPKMPFTEVLERTERLGAKKPVQTCVKRIRLGMPILPSDFAEEEEQDVHREGDGDDGSNREDATVTNSNPFSSQVPNDDEIDEFLSTAAEIEREETLVQSQSVLQAPPSQPKNTTISEEAKARIERSKKLAMERRAARLAKGNNELTNNSVPPSPSRPRDLASQEIELDKADDSEKQPSQQDDMFEMMYDKNDISRSDSVVDNDDDLRVDHNLPGVEEHELNSVSTDNKSKRECAKSPQADSQEDGRQGQNSLSPNKPNDPEEINLGDVGI